MNKRTPQPQSQPSPHGERKNEVSKRDQHLLPQMQTPHRSCGSGLQGRQTADPIVGSQTTRKTQTRIRRTEISRAKTDRQNNQESPCQAKMSNLQLYNREAWHQAEKTGGLQLTLAMGTNSEAPKHIPKSQMPEVRERTGNFRENQQLCEMHRLR
jgi:hypothetical protein